MTEHPDAAALLDQRERDLARCDDGALVGYQRKWEKRLARLQRSRPRHWSVGGLSPEEVRDALTLRLIELIRGDVDAWSRYERPGKEWGLCVMQSHLGVLRTAFRLHATPTDFQAEVAVPDRALGFEEQCLEYEAGLCRDLARQSAEADLSLPQRRWWAAMKLAARGGQFFAASAELNLSSVSRVLGKNRSSAVRAYRELQERFLRERERFE
jgi:hypothetical protein